MNVASAELLAACVLNEETVLLLLQICVKEEAAAGRPEGGRHQGQRNPYDVCECVCVWNSWSHAHLRCKKDAIGGPSLPNAIRLTLS
jgi:hypothetical protein